MQYRTLLLSRFTPDETRQDGDCKDNVGHIEAMSVGAFEAHPKGVAGMAVMYSTTEACSAVSTDSPPETSSGVQEGGVGQVGGLLVTCGKEEGMVKIWDYTHVGEGGSCGRLGSGIRVETGRMLDLRFLSGRAVRGSLCLSRRSL